MTTQTCDGTNPATTRTIRAEDYDPAVHHRHPADDSDPATDLIVTHCNCGRTFDDRRRQTYWPHHPIEQPPPDTRPPAYDPATGHDEDTTARRTRPPDHTRDGDDHGNPNPIA